MRIARVLHNLRDDDDERDGAPLLPTLALERDGALYSVSALASSYGPRFAALADAEFRRVVCGLGAEALTEMDARLASGDRPGAARILPGSFLWLPPIDTDRAAFLCVTDVDPEEDVPRFAIGSARAALAHTDRAAIGAATLLGAIGVILGDDLHRATSVEASRAMMGVTPVLWWRGARSGPGALLAHLGPMLVTCDQAGVPDRIRVQAWCDGREVPSQDRASQRFAAAEQVAWISQHVPLAAGDVVALEALVRFPGAPEDRAELLVERVGRLQARRAPPLPPTDWRDAR